MYSWSPRRATADGLTNILPRKFLNIFSKEGHVSSLGSGLIGKEVYALGRKILLATRSAGGLILRVGNA